MKTKVVSLTWLTVFWICCNSAQAAPVESDKGKNEFVFLLPAGNGGSNLFSGVSVNLEPPVGDTYRNAKDSYGNPVSPFGILTNDNPDDYMKDLNVAGLQFEIPSYASGITEIRKPTNELLPPLASGEVPADALHTPAVDQPPVDLLPPITNQNLSPSAPKDDKINEITDTLHASSGQSQTKKDQDKEIETKTENHSGNEKYEGEKYTGGFGGPPGILGEQKERGYAIKDEEDKKEEESVTKEDPNNRDNDNGNSNTPSEATPTAFPSPNSQSSETSTSLNSIFNSGTTQINIQGEAESPSKTLPDSKPITTSVQEQNPPSLNLDATLGGLLPPPLPTGEISPLQVSHPLSERFGPEQDFQQPAQSAEPAQPAQPSQESFLVPLTFPNNIDPTATLPQNLPPREETDLPLGGSLFPAQTPSDGIGKYSGGFGGAAGVLGPTATLPQNLSPREETELPLRGSLFPTETPNDGIGKYSGGFGGAPGVLGPTATLSQNLPPREGTELPLRGSLFPAKAPSDGIGKYTGGFGGAPGILGNQNKPGYAVQPDGSIKDPDHTYRPPVGGAIAVTATQAPTPAPSLNPIAAPVKYEQYTGGFGGPPGILAPFDKH